VGLKIFPNPSRTFSPGMNAGNAEDAEPANFIGNADFPA
jgi:hypothetical protein